eukprot:6191976-Pleurochrysis_carterae.AAC.1
MHAMEMEGRACIELCPLLLRADAAAAAVAIATRGVELATTLEIDEALGVCHTQMADCLIAENKTKEVRTRELQGTHIRSESYARARWYTHAHASNARTRSRQTHARSRRLRLPHVNSSPVSPAQLPRTACSVLALPLATNSP